MHLLPSYTMNCWLYSSYTVQCETFGSFLHCVWECAGCMCVCSLDERSQQYLTPDHTLPSGLSDDYRTSVSERTQKKLACMFNCSQEGYSSAPETSTWFTIKTWVRCLLDILYMELSSGSTTLNQGHGQGEGSGGDSLVRLPNYLHTKGLLLLQVSPDVDVNTLKLKLKVSIQTSVVAHSCAAVWTSTT